MPEHTLTYDEKVRGWTSFHSYIPEYSVNLNNEYFTFKNGQLYLHNKTTGDRNTFYGTAYNTEIELLSNAAPSDIKIYKTIEIEGNSGDWDVTVVTNLDTGHINKESFVKTEDHVGSSTVSPNTYEEGFYSTHIRRDSADEDNFELLSVQGVGNLSLINGLLYTFTQGVPSSISVGDALYRATGGSYERIGTITNTDGTTITMGTAAITPSPGDFIFAAKSPIAESFGLKGYYASVRLVNASTSAVELYAVNSEVAKSFE
jgi:hypothetical protein